MHRRPLHRTATKIGSEAGAALFEIPLCVPLILTLVIATFDFGEYYFTEQRLGIIGCEIGNAALNRCVFPDSDYQQCLGNLTGDIHNLVIDTFPELASEGNIYLKIYVEDPDDHSVSEATLDLFYRENGNNKPSRLSAGSDVISDLLPHYGPPLSVEVFYPFKPLVPLGSLFDFTHKTTIYKVSIH